MSKQKVKDCNSSLNSQMAMKWYPKLKLVYKGALMFFEVIFQISRIRRPRNQWFGSDLSVSRWLLQFKLTDGYEMTHIASRSIEEVLYCFSRSSVKFEDHTGQKIDDLAAIWAFADDNPSFNLQTKKLLILNRIEHSQTVNSHLNSQISKKWYQKFELAYKILPYCISMSFTKFPGHTYWKIDDLALI